MMMMMMGRLPRFFFWRSFTHLNENIHILDIFNDVYYYIPLKFNHFFMQKRQPRPIIIIIIIKWLWLYDSCVCCVYLSSSSHDVDVLKKNFQGKRMWKKYKKKQLLMMFESIQIFFFLFLHYLIAEILFIFFHFFWLFENWIFFSG